MSDNSTTDTPGTDHPSTDPATPAQRYLAEVADHLAGLSDDERDDLLDDLAAHLHEVAADDPRPLHETLGPPDRFAAELLASAGLADRAHTGVTTTRLARLRAQGRRLRDHRWTQATLDFLPELRPAWWVLRGYLVVLGVAALFADGDTDLDAFPVPTLGSPVVGLAAVVAAVVLSVRLGRSPSSSRRGVRLIDGVAVVLGLVALAHVNAGIEGNVARDRAYADSGSRADVNPPMGGLHYASAMGGPITNIYAYDPNGQLIPEVLLYDQDGHPLDLGDVPYDPTTGESLTTYHPVDANGAQIRNAYPLEQRTVEFDPRGTRREQPVPPPALVVPPPSTTTTAPAIPAPPAPPAP